MKTENRVLKFRVWDSFRNQMINNAVSSFASVNDDGAIDTTGVFDVNPLMQFTGILDKAGKEIYEGDVVIQEKWVSVGKYVPAKGVVKYKGVGFTCECVGDWFGSNADLNGNAIVIGNVFSNPELL